VDEGIPSIAKDGLCVPYFSKLSKLWHSAAFYETEAFDWFLLG
jgi:hypothetical protein